MVPERRKSIKRKSFGSNEDHDSKPSRSLIPEIPDLLRLSGCGSLQLCLRDYYIKQLLNDVKAFQFITLFSFLNWDVSVLSEFLAKRRLGSIEDCKIIRNMLVSGERLHFVFKPDVPFVRQIDDEYLRRREESNNEREVNGGENAGQISNISKHDQNDHQVDLVNKIQHILSL
jgi:hypothetical protein